MLTFKVKTGDFSSVLPSTNKAEKILATQVMTDTDKFVPALTGNFAQRVHLEESTIVYPGPFARFLYYGKVMIYEPTGSTWAPKNEHKVVTGRDLAMNKSMHPLASSHWFEVSKAANLDTWIKVAERLVKQNADK
jgi:hypothetical protein